MTLASRTRAPSVAQCFLCLGRCASSEGGVVLSAHLRADGLARNSARRIAFLTMMGGYASLGWDYMQSAWKPEQKDTVVLNAFVGAGLYLFTFCLSIFYCIKTARKNALIQYRDLDD